MCKLVLIHTVTSVIPAFRDLCAELLPRVTVRHLVDETILPELIRIGRLEPSITRRVCELIVRAEQAGADAVMLTCSSISPCADVGRQLVSVPVLKVDEPMADKAVRLASNIGVAATLPTTLGPTVELVRQRAAARGKRVRITTELCAGAFEAGQAGNTIEHDETVARAIEQLARRCKVVVLAQASMARVLPVLGPMKPAAILTSPRLAVMQARRVLK